jgi:hypothetical protein
VLEMQPLRIRLECQHFNLLVSSSVVRQLTNQKGGVLWPDSAIGVCGSCVPATLDLSDLNAESSRSVRLAIALEEVVMFQPI